MKKINLTLIITALILQCSLSAFAQGRISVTQKNAQITINVDIGREEKSVPVLIKVVGEDGKINFIGDNYTDENGKYSVTYKVNEDGGIFTVKASENGTIMEDCVFLVRTKRIENELIEVLETQAASKDKDSQPLKEIMERYRPALEADETVFNELINSDAVYEKMVKDEKNKSVKNFETFRNAFYGAVMLQKFYELDDKTQICELLTDEPYRTVFGEFAAERLEEATDEITKASAKSMKADYNSCEEFTQNFEFAILKYSIKNLPLWSNVKTVVEKYKDKIGITKTVSNSAYKSITGKSFASYSEIKSALTEIKTSSGGSGGGGKSSKTVAKGESIIVTPVNPPVTEAEVTVNSGKSIFTDMDGYKWAEEAVMHIQSLGIVNGTGDGKFTPERIVTREEAVKMLMLLYKKEITAYPSVIPFTDVANDRWSFPYIAYAYGSKVINGKSESFFGATDTVTRQEMAVMAWNVMKLMGFNDKGREKFGDSDDVALWAKDAVEILGNYGIIHGRSAAKGFVFAPTDDLSRAEAAVIISNIAKKLKQER